MIRDISYILTGYILGSVLFAKVFCSWLKKADVTQNTADGNPGTTNAFKNGGFLCGTLTLICDILKGFQQIQRRKRHSNHIRVSFRDIAELCSAHRVCGDIRFLFGHNLHKIAFSQNACDIYLHGTCNHFS